MPRPAASRPTPARSRPLLTALAALVVAALAATGCVSMPSGGPVLSYPVTQGTDAQNQPFVQIQPQPPGNGWSPSQIVQGFLTASANFGSYPQVARQYLTPEEQKIWDPFWSAIVYKSGPSVTAPTYPSGAKNPTSATVEVTGTVQANLLGNGSYSVPSASTPGSPPNPTPRFKLVKAHGQWRIATAPLELLLTSNSFENDYQLRNLYFFDPLDQFLVPDPVYVPLRPPNDLMDGLVNELIAPPSDWLSAGATKTAFPPKTKVSSVGLDGPIAVVNLTGAAIAKASPQVMRQVSAQLLSTLSVGAPSDSHGQGVQSVEVVVNGKPWVPPHGQGNPVQHTTAWHPASGASKEFYSVTSKGYLTSRTTPGSKPVSIAKIGTNFDQIAVSPDGTYLAALRDGTLYADSLADGSLTRQGTGFTAISWDVNDNLWALQGGQVVMFRGTSNAHRPLGGMVPVPVSAQLSGAQGPYTELQVAPDGVRVALVSGGNELTFGAISRPQGQNPQITLSLVQETPLTQVQPAPQAANFVALTWYGPDHVITLATPGPVVTEYPVSGAAPTPLQAEPDMQTITASAGQPFIAGLPKGRMSVDPGLIGSWTTVNDGDAPADGSSPTYPG